ncbi:fad binding domain protein [Rutstroemia sp. NJR-2017a WRK4]|nr:fad binding domain protein [Rutstroemia sp. NJR-2017a WRK4]
MGRLAGLIGSGIGLAIEAKSSYQSPQANKSYNTDIIRGQSYSDHAKISGQLSVREFPSSDDQRAQQDLRNYADYQSRLSDRINADLRGGENYRRYLASRPVGQPRNGPYEKDVSFYDYELPIEESKHTGRLSQPVIIPQRRPEDQSRGILRAYAPALGDCGIDQHTFLDFIDEFNEAHKSSPYLDAVNVTAQGVGFAPGIAPLVVSITVPIAVQAAKGYQTKRQSASFLDRANERIFKPRGLFAMILTYKPSRAQQPYNSTTEVQLPTSAPLVYPTDERGMQQTGLKKMGHFIADYGDKRAQARFASNNPDSALASGPAPTFKSRWGDPNHPANSGGLRSLLTGVPDDKNDRKRGDGGRRERRRRRNSESSRGGLLSTAMEAVGGDRRRIDGGRPSLVGGVKGMIAGPGKENQSLIKTVRGLGMKTDVLYLMITNNTDDPSLDVSPMPVDRAVYQSRRQIHPQIYRRENLSGHSSLPTDPAAYPNPVSSYQNNNPYASSYSVSASSSHEQYDGPPPAYREAMPTQYYDCVRSDGDYCVPTM